MGSPLQAGWYIDHEDVAFARWHDGVGWTRHTILRADWHRRTPPPPTGNDRGGPGVIPPVPTGAIDLPLAGRTVFCRDCGEPMGETQRFCGDCGAPWGPPEYIWVEPPASLEEDPNAHLGNDVLHRLMWKSVLVCFVLFLTEDLAFGNGVDLKGEAMVALIVGIPFAWFAWALQRTANNLDHWIFGSRRR